MEKPKLDTSFIDLVDGYKRKLEQKDNIIKDQKELIRQLKQLVEQTEQSK